MKDWQARCAHVYASLEPEARGRVLDSVQSNVIEGWEPTEEDVRRLVRLELGEITSLEAFAEIAAAMARNAPPRDRGCRP